jgi:hypothetical protein
MRRAREVKGEFGFGFGLFRSASTSPLAARPFWEYILFSIFLFYFIFLQRNNNAIEMYYDIRGHERYIACMYGTRLFNSP